MADEARLRQRVYRTLKKWNVFYWSGVGNPMQRRGMPDVNCIIDGEYVGLELKGPKGKQTPMQQEAEKKIKKAGGGYFVIRSISELEDVLGDYYSE